MAHDIQIDPAQTVLFFTVPLRQRGSDLLVLEIERLRQAVRLTRAERPFHIGAWVVMPDHLHTIWTIPDDDHSGRWRRIKARFSASLPKPPQRQGPALGGVWHPKLWVHKIADAADLQFHMRACQMDPVRHGLVDAPGDWPYSSFKTRPALELAG